MPKPDQLTDSRSYLTQHQAAPPLTSWVIAFGLVAVIALGMMLFDLIT